MRPVPRALSPANLAGAGAIGLWAFLALLSRAAASIPPLQLVAMSFGVSAVLGLGWLAARGRLRDLRQGWPAWVHGAGGLFLYHALYFAALGRAPAATANLINYTWPLLIVLLSGALLGMRLSGRHGLGVGLAVAGCGVLLGAGAAFSPGAGLGYALAAGASLTWALYSVLARRFDAPATAVAGFCGGAALLAGALHLLTENTAPLTPGIAIVVLAMGVGPVGLAFALWDIGMKRGDPRLLGTLAFATPVLSTLLLAVAGEAPFTGRTLLAALLVAAGGFVAGREAG